MRVLVSIPGTETASVHVELRARYGLTPTEAAVAEVVSRGEGAKSAATTPGMTSSALRWCLKTAFERTGMYVEPNSCASSSAFAPVRGLQGHAREGTSRHSERLLRSLTPPLHSRPPRVQRTIGPVRFQQERIGVFFRYITEVEARDGWH